MTAARTILAGMVLSSAVAGWLCHGRTTRVNGWWSAGVAVTEAVLIWLVGGWS